LEDFSIARCHIASASEVVSWVITQPEI